MKTIPREVVKRKKVASWSKEIREMRHKSNLTSIQENVLIGTILGDGCLIENVGRKNYRLQIEQCIKQKEYVLWKYQIFKEWTVGEPKLQEKNLSWRFRTISHPVFNEFRNLFYRDKVKIIPENIEVILKNPISLAVWFMDDGLRRGKNGFSVCVHSFKTDEIKKLQDCLYKNFGLLTNKHWDGKGNQLYFPVSQKDNLRQILDSFILPEFRYKFPFY